MFTDHSRALALELRHAQAELADTREELVRTLRGFEGGLARALGWRAWIRRRPVFFLGTAFALGWFLGRRDR